MHGIRVLLSIEPRLERQLLEFSLDQHSEVEIVGKSLNAIEILAMIAQAKPHVWIHSFGSRSDFGTIRSHVESIAPQLAIVNIERGEASSYLQIPVNSVDELVVQSLRYIESTNPYSASNP